MDITPYVYGVSGRQWNDVPRQAEQLKKEHGEEVDAIVVLMGTNDFNSSVPVGTWVYRERRAGEWLPVVKLKNWKRVKGVFL